jgi:hypothetical protein
VKNSEAKQIWTLCSKLDEAQRILASLPSKFSAFQPIAEELDLVLDKAIEITQKCGIRYSL